jgi:hypothetical protein
VEVGPRLTRHVGKSTVAAGEADQLHRAAEGFESGLGVVRLGEDDVDAGQQLPVLVEEPLGVRNEGRARAPTPSQASTITCMKTTTSNRVSVGAASSATWRRTSWPAPADPDRHPSRRTRQPRPDVDRVEDVAEGGLVGAGAGGDADEHHVHAVPFDVVGRGRPVGGRPEAGDGPSSVSAKATR